MANGESVKRLIEQGLASLSLGYLGSRLLQSGEMPQALSDALAKSSAALYFERAVPRGFHRRDLKRDFALAQENPRLGLFLLQGAITNLLVLVGDEVKRAQAHPREQWAQPLFELLRHLRNAAAHGNRFKFRAGEPRRPAEFRHFHLDPTMNGRENVLFDFIPPGDVLDLLETIHSHL